MPRVVGSPPRVLTCAPSAWLLSLPSYFDAGAKYATFYLQDPKLRTTGTPGKKLVPVFDDPIFLQKLERFVKALAARYDGHARIAFIDIRSYGNWGEAHMHPFRKPDISPEDFRRHIQMHRDAFHQTRLVIPGGNKKFEALYDWPVSIGIGMRRDGIFAHWLNSFGRWG